MTPIYTLPLADSQASLETVGGKGASLARLVHAGLPVPDGFHITTEAYRQFISYNNLGTTIQAALDLVDISAMPSSRNGACVCAHLRDFSNPQRRKPLIRARTPCSADSRRSM